MNEAFLRAEATQRTLNKWRDKPFEWGKYDCARMAIEHLRRFGHKPKIAKAGKWNSPLSARAALERMGFADLGDAMNAQGLEQIGGAMAMIGDIALIEADHPMGCLCICIGPNQWLSLHEHAEGFTIVEIVEFKAAWRVTWRKR